MKRFHAPIALLLVLSFLAYGCATISPGQSATVVRGDQTERAAFTLADSFVRLEYAQAQTGTPLETTLPGIHAAANKVRALGPKAFRDVHRLIDTYAATKANSTPDLDAALIILNQIITDVQTWHLGAVRHARSARIAAMLPVGDILAILQTLFEIYRGISQQISTSGPVDVPARAALAAQEEAAFTSQAWQVMP